MLRFLGAPATGELVVFRMTLSGPKRKHLAHSLGRGICMVR